MHMDVVEMGQLLGGVVVTERLSGAARVPFVRFCVLDTAATMAEFMKSQRKEYYRVSMVVAGTKSPKGCAAETGAE